MWLTNVMHLGTVRFYILFLHYSQYSLDILPSQESLPQLLYTQLQLPTFCHPQACPIPLLPALSCPISYLFSIAPLFSKTLSNTLFISGCLHLLKCELRKSRHPCLFCFPFCYLGLDPGNSVWLSGCAVNLYQSEEIDFESGNVIFMPPSSTKAAAAV